MKKLLIVALVMAIITGFAVYFYANSLQDSLNVKSVPVIVAAKQIPKNTLIISSMLVTKQFPAEAVNALAARNLKDVVGLITKENIEPDEQVLTTKLSESGNVNSGLSYVIKQGYRALTVKIDEIIGVAGYINKGDRVDIAAVMLSKQNNVQVLVSELVAENIEVLEIGAKTDASGNTQSASVTISVPIKDLMLINYALSEGKYRLILRSVLDKKTGEISPYLP